MINNKMFVSASVVLHVAQAGNEAFCAYRSVGYGKASHAARSLIAAVKAAETASGKTCLVGNTCSAVIDFADDAHAYATQPRTRMRTITLISSAVAAGVGIVIIARSDDSKNEGRVNATALFDVASAASSLFRACSR